MPKGLREIPTDRLRGFMQHDDHAGKADSAKLEPDQPETEAAEGEKSAEPGKDRPNDPTRELGPKGRRGGKNL